MIIKFNAWDKEDKIMLLWNELCMDDQLLADIILNNTRYITLLFIGISDCENSELYQGDIVFNSNKTLLTCKEDPRLYEIKYQEAEFGLTGDSGNVWLKKTPGFIFKKINPESKNYMSLIFSQKQIKRVGNIYEGLKIDL